MKTSIFESGEGSTMSNNSDNMINLGKGRIVRIYNPDGSYKDFPISGSASFQDEKGNWRDEDFKCIQLDGQGIPLPDGLEGVTVSHTGQLTPPGSYARCNSGLHPPGLTRNVYIDVDGSVNDDGAICSTCMRRRLFFNMAVLALGICLVIGFVKGLGWF